MKQQPGLKAYRYRALRKLPDSWNRNRSNRSKRRFARKIALSIPIAFAMVLAGSNARGFSVTTDSDTYYRIGGASALSASPTYARSREIGASVDLRSAYSCGKFDLLENLEELFSNFKDDLDDAVQVLVYAAQSALASLPLYLLRRADPNLAAMFEKAMARYEAYVRLAVRSCEENERLIMQGKNPYADWIALARKIKWDDQGREAEEGDGPTATEARETVDEEGGDIIWKDGERRGGKDQEPVRIVGDVVQAGYEVLEEGTGAGGEIGKIKTVWPSVDDARTWAVAVLGEYVIVTDPEQAPATTPGLGVHIQVVETEQEILEQLTKIANGELPPTPENLEALSGGGTVITPEVIRALKEQDAGAREVYVKRLASEIALARAAEEIILMRRILLTGVQEPNISVSPAWDHVYDYLLPVLDTEYEYLRQENALRREFVSQTALALLQEERRERSRVPVGGRSRSAPLKDGAVMKE